MAVGRPRSRPTVAGAALALVLAGWSGMVAAADASGAAPRPRAAACTGPAAVDFDRDGCGDLVVGTPGDTNGTGAVQVFYGTSGGFDAYAPTGYTQLWTQDTPGVNCTAAPGDLFGAATATGDFNGDGYTDLAIGAPSKTVLGKPDAGAVNVLFGGPNGLGTTGNACIVERLTGTPFPLRAGSLFGTTLASGDFDGDGIDDLAIGLPGLTVTGLRDAGGVQLLRGTPGGMRWSTAFTQNSPGVAGRPGTGAAFGFALAAGRLGTAALDGLAVGAPGEVIGGKLDVGTVNLFAGTAAGGLVDLRSHPYSEALASYGTTPQARDSYGWSIAIGDIDADGAGDLVVGVPGKVGLNQEFAGAVVWNKGSGGFVSRTGSLINAETPGVAGRSTRNYEFGHTVAILPVDDVGGTAKNALLIGVPYETVSGVPEGGTLHVIPVSSTPGAGPAFASETKLSLSSSMCTACGPTQSGWFGITVAASDLDGDGVPALAIGSPGEDIGSVVAAGAVTVLADDQSAGLGYGMPPNADHIFQNSPGVASSSKPGEFFGAALSPP